VRLRPVFALSLAMALAASTTAAITATASSSAPSAAVAATGLPAGAPPAAHRAEPQLPKPKGWPFSESFSRTSGTGRLAGGASYWTDFVYDDHGAVGVEQGQTSSLAPTIGTYTYPAGAAHGNGADIFRAAIGLDSAASYWRVDWTTLVDPKLPVAEWALDTDGIATSTATTWPAGAGVKSPGIDRAIVVSSHGARLLNQAGTVLRVLPVTVDMAARSFVVRIPRSVLPVANTWQVRLAAGLANAGGNGFAPVTPANGALPGEPAVYNVAFRTAKQEAASCGGCSPLDLRGIDHGAQTLNANLWNEIAQATSLAQQGDVSAYSLGVKWSDLEARRATPDPLVRGSSTRWYVTTLHLGEGVIPGKQDPASQAGGDLRPNYLARIQPYSVHVPDSYQPGQAMPLTWVLHSLGENHNQYAGLGPKFLNQLCDGRQSICATTLGFGADGWYFDEAEVDFWQVWRELAKHYTLDPTHTVVSGYSMGGFGSYKLGLTYPDVFAAAMPIAGPSVCGSRLYDGAVKYSAPGRCTDDSDTQPLVANARWLPYVIADGVLDQLVPITGVLQQIQKFDDAGLRYKFWAYPTEDHLVYAVQDGFSHEVAALGHPTVMQNPGEFHYAWYPQGSDPALGLGPTGIYWLRALHARDRSAGKLASIDASSGARPAGAHLVLKTRSVDAPGDPTPAVVQTSVWSPLGPPAAAKRTLTLSLTNVQGLSVDMGRAGLATGPVKVTINSDGPTRVRFLRGGTTKIVTVPSGTTIFLLT
jgi:predicted esterase